MFLGFPVVTKDWLLQCYKRKRKCPLDKFIVGVSKVSDQFIFEELESIEEDAVDEMEVQLNEEKDLNNSNNEVPQCILSRNAFNNMGVELTEMAKKSEQLLNQIAENREQREKELKEDDVRLKAILEAEPNDDINFEEVDSKILKYKILYMIIIYRFINRKLERGRYSNTCSKSYY